MYKGQTTIELLNQKTQQREVYQDENLVTNAVPDIFKYNPSCLLYSYGSPLVRFDQEIFPIATKCYGGLLLFEDQLVEDVNQYFPSSTNPITGYASQDTNETENAKRGSLNLTESGPIEKGYKFVWDFTTSQANGRISSLALTHYLAGKSYYGDTYSSSDAYLLMGRISRGLNAERMNYYNWMVETDYTNNTITSIVPKNDKTIDIVVFKEPLASLGLNDNVGGTSKQILRKVTHAIPEFYEGLNYTHYVDFHDGQDGYWYGFINRTDSQRNHTRINCIKINKKDYSFSINHWVLDDVLTASLGSISFHNTGTIKRTRYSFIKEGYLYVANTTLESIYKLNIENPIDISKIDLGYKSNYYGGSNTSSYIYPWGDYLRGYDFIINQQDQVMKTAGDGMPYVATPMIEIGPYRLGYQITQNYSNAVLETTLYLHTPYLGTINNLATPILKTADKTMKDTYTLTEMEV